jgi:UDP-2,4-diacetamido-2,4,6-trideoxy-beta-L-altropyranose hydrolase
MRLPLVDDKALLIIRADASSEIGAGHIMRCLAVAQAWQDIGGHVSFVSAKLPAPLKERIAAEGFECLPVQAVAGTLEDADECMTMAKDQKALALILDGYHFNERYHEFVSQFACVTLAIEDYCRLPHYSTDFVLNQNLGAAFEAYPSVHDRTQLLLGTQYALLRREFMQSSSSPYSTSNKNRPFRCLITLGGSDFDNITGRVIQGLQLLNLLDLEVHVIVGGLNPHGEALAHLVSGDKRFSLLQNVCNMAAEYAWADFAVAAGGSSNWEMCYFGLPRVVVVIADNQRAIAEQLQRAEIGINIGVGPEITPERIAAAINLLRLDPGRFSVAQHQALRLVDGLGAKRCVDRLLSFSRPSRCRDRETHSS